MIFVFVTSGGMISRREGQCNPPATSARDIRPRDPTCKFTSAARGAPRSSRIFRVAHDLAMG